MKKTLIPALKLIIFFGLGIVLVWLSIRGLTGDDRRDILDSFRHANYWWVFAGLLLGGLSHFIRALRWNQLLGTFGEHPRPFVTFQAVMAGYLANLAVPRLGEVTRCTVLYKAERIPVQKSLGSVFTERSIDLLTYGMLFVYLILTQYGRLKEYLEQNIYPNLKGKFASILTVQNFLILVLLGALGVLVVFVLRKRLEKNPFFHKVFNLLRGFWQGLFSVFRLKKPWLFILYTVSIWVLYYLMIYLCFFALPQTEGLTISAGWAVLVLGTIGIMLTPGGIGLYPIIVAQTLLLYAIDYNAGFALGWITWVSQTAMILLLGTPSLVNLLISKNRDVAS